MGCRGQAKRVSQDPRHDRCSLIRNDLQQLRGASDKKIKGGMKDDEVLIWKRLCSASPSFPHPHHFPIRRQTSGMLNQHPPWIQRSRPEPQHRPHPSYTSDLQSARWGPPYKNIHTQSYSSAGRGHSEYRSYI